jgi:tetratricopeptide (TPR) repeat protein
MELILQDSNSPTLCLNMIVKNESRIIRRLLDSVISIIDSYCICDTGSTDNTVQIIEDYFKEKGMYGKIVKEPFKDFSHNRNFALQACNGLSDYVLFLDADMILEIHNFDKSLLTKGDYFMILQGNDSICYYNTRIIKNNGLYKYVSVTHEYIDTPENSIRLELAKNTLFIKDISDGGSKHDKFDRDIKLLLNGIKNEPNNVRYYFYLANSYHDIGRFGEAINVYKKRIELGGWNQEVWYSYYRIGLCFKNMDKFSDALYYWLEGYNYYPDRLEAIYEIINKYRIDSKHVLAMEFYKMAKKILDKNENIYNHLFLQQQVYLYKIYLEYTIFAYYCGVKNINDEVIQIFNNCNNGNDLNNLLINMKFYNHVLDKKSIYDLDNTTITNVNGEAIEFVSSSSCLIKKPDNNGYFLNVRYVNYKIIQENGSYINCDKHIISINKFVEFDNQFSVIEDKWMDLEFDGRRYIGVEDVKIYYDNYSNKLEYIGTGYHSNETIGIVSGDYRLDEKKLEVNELKQNFNNTVCEKNWVFMDYKNETHIVYDWHPLRIGKLNESNILEIVDQKNTPKFFSRIRGSSNGFLYKKKIDANNKGNIKIDIIESEIWFVNHLVSYESPRSYYHIIYVFDSNMNLLRYSAPFKFEGESIEYCLSIVVEDERVIINYSVWDRTTKIAIYDMDYINSLLKYN